MIFCPYLDKYPILFLRFSIKFHRIAQSLAQNFAYCLALDFYKYWIIQLIRFYVSQQLVEIRMSKASKRTQAKKQAQEQEEYATSVDGFWKKYSSETHPRVKVIDLFIIFLMSIIGIQFFYRLIVGDDFPKNAFLTGMFCPLGVIVLLSAIRGQKKDYRKLGEFFIACLVLFIVSINFLG